MPQLSKLPDDLSVTLSDEVVIIDRAGTKKASLQELSDLISNVPITDGIIPVSYNKRYIASPYTLKNPDVYFFDGAPTSDKTRNIYALNATTLEVGSFISVSIFGLSPVSVGAFGFITNIDGDQTSFSITALDPAARTITITPALSNVSDFSESKLGNNISFVNVDSTEILSDMQISGDIIARDAVRVGITDNAGTFTITPSAAPVQGQVLSFQNTTVGFQPGSVGANYISGLIPAANLAHGTPNNGQGISYNATNQRFEFIDLTSSADFTEAISSTSTDAGSAVQDGLILYRNSASPANNDALMDIKFQGRDNFSSDATNYARIESYIAHAGLSGTDQVHAGGLKIYTQPGIIGQANPTEIVDFGSQVSTFKREIIIDNDTTSTSPRLDLYRNDSSPTDGDTLGTIFFSGDDSGANRTYYASIIGKSDDVTNATEDASIELAARNNGTMTTIATIKGDGLTINSGSIFLGGTGSANEFDDYETGTWNPSVSVASGETLSNRSGRYTKVGELVHCSIEFTIASTNSSVTTEASATISNLPFVVDTDANDGHMGGLTYTDGANFSAIDGHERIWGGGATNSIRCRHSLPASTTYKFAGHFTYKTSA